MTQIGGLVGFDSINSSMSGPPLWTRGPFDTNKDSNECVRVNRFSLRTTMSFYLFMHSVLF